MCAMLKGSQKMITNKGAAFLSQTTAKGLRHMTAATSVWQQCLRMLQFRLSLHITWPVARQEKASAYISEAQRETRKLSIRQWTRRPIKQNANDDDGSYSHTDCLYVIIKKCRTLNVSLVKLVSVYKGFAKQTFLSEQTVSQKDLTRVLLRSRTFSSGSTKLMQHFSSLRSTAARNTAALLFFFY